MKYKTLSILSILLLITFLIPIFAIGFFAVPQGDDFGFSGDVHHVVRNGGSLLDILGAAVYRAKETYYSWQGSFSAIFLMALQPGVFGFKYYTLSTFILVFSLIGGIAFFSYCFYGELFGLNKWSVLIISVFESIECTQFVPLAYQSFYWYNGSIYYTFFFSLSLFLYGAIIKFVLKGKFPRLLIITLLCAFIGGGNYITALTTVIIIGLTVILLLIKRNRRFLSLLIPLFAIIASLLISMLAPGNSQRQQSSATLMWILDTFLIALKFSIEFIKDNYTLSLLGIILFLSPIIYKEAGSCTKDFNCPLLVTFLSFGIFWSMFVPHVYAVRTAGSSRLYNIYFFALIVLTVINVFYWFGWFRRKNIAEATDKISFSLIVVSSIIACVLVLFSIIKEDARLTSIMAVGELRSGEAEAFYSQMLEREKILEDESDKNIVLESLHSTPYLLFSEDMKSDSGHFMNADAATYFGKDSIIVK